MQNSLLLLPKSQVIEKLSTERQRSEESEHGRLVLRGKQIKLEGGGGAGVEGAAGKEQHLLPRIIQKERLVGDLVKM
jgi:hypothetical protein